MALPEACQAGFPRQTVGPRRVQIRAASLDSSHFPGRPLHDVAFGPAQCGSTEEVAMTIVTVIFSLLFLGLGVGMVFWARSTRKKAQASQAWPTAAGTVVSSVVKVERSSTMDGEMQDTVSYRPIVSYRYAVEGVEHTGSHITFGPASYTKGSAHTMAGKFPPAPACPSSTTPRSRWRQSSRGKPAAARCSRSGALCSCWWV